jgi:predicted amidohydrolase YtcJ
MLSSASELAPTGSVAYVNGNVYTVNTAQRWAEAFIVVETV